MKEFLAHLDFYSLGSGTLVMITLQNGLGVAALLFSIAWNAIKIYDYFKNKKIKKDHE